MSDDGSITIKKESLWKYSTFLLLAILIIGAFVTFNKGGTTNLIANDQNAGTLPAVQGKVDVKIGDSPILGNKDAKVTIVEFSDYQCPFCERHFQQTYPQLKKDYIDTGKVRLVFKDFPLSFHENAQKAAEAARCVREQKGDTGYFEMHSKLFSNQATLSVDNEKKWARELGVDGAKFDSCLDSGKYAKAVQADQTYGGSIGISGTPGFFINGKILEGAYPYDTFKKMIDAEL